MPDDPDGYFIVSILLSIFFSALAALYAAGESALDTLSVSQVKRDADAGDRKARSLLKIMEAQESVVSPLQSGLLFCGLLGLSFCVTAFGGRTYPETLLHGELQRMLVCLLAAQKRGPPFQRAICVPSPWNDEGALPRSHAISVFYQLYGQLRSAPVPNRPPQLG